jgi:malonyl CoA-acyl carrier protein transacylase
MIAFVFPGQGSQRRGMGQGLFDEVREYAAVEKDVDTILGYSLRKLCLEDADNRLKETQFTQPSLYVVNALYHYKAVSQGAHPACLAGHSLGEYNALLAAGVFDFLTGLRLVKKRGELMSQAKCGGMAAVIGLIPSMIAKVIEENGLSSIDIANFNSPSQTVVSGPVEDIKRAGPLFEKGGARMYMHLPVSAAFHSRYMADAAKVFADFLVPMSFAVPKTLVLANVTAQPYPTDNASESVKSLLVNQMTHSVQWVRSIRFLIGQGVTQFNEMGPGNVLTKSVQQIQQEKEGDNVSQQLPGSIGMPHAEAVTPRSM